MIAIIAARSQNNIIGKNGHLPWNIPGEMRQFRELTTGNIVVMGRKTYEDIGHPLPGRINVVISKTAHFSGEELCTLPDLQSAIQYAQANYPEKDIYIGGGYRLFEEALPLASKIYLTEVKLTISREPGDVVTAFPEFDAKRYEKKILEETDQYIRYGFERISE